MMPARMWNGRPAGLPAAVLESAASALVQLGDRLSTLLWRRNLAACGPGTRILWWPTIRHPRLVRLGRDVILARGVTLSAETDGGGLSVGDGTWIGEGCRIDFTGAVEIGAGCTLSPGVQVFSHSHGRDPRSRPVGLPLKIGDRVWIGSEAIVLQNVTEIPDDCVIGARALVTRNPKPGEIVGGNPAAPIARRG